MSAPVLRAVVAGDVPDYPISAAERLDSHFYTAWNIKRWMASDFRRHSYDDPEVGFYGVELFWIAQGETPLGTLPVDDTALAFLLRMPVTRWRELAGRSVTPLHGWSRVLCDNGQVRLAHPVVTEVALDALAGKRRNSAKNSDDRMRKRLGQIAEVLTDKLGGAHAARNDELVNAISDWIQDTYPGGSCTQKRIREAWEALSMARR